MPGREDWAARKLTGMLEIPMRNFLISLARKCGYEQCGFLTSTSQFRSGIVLEKRLGSYLFVIIPSRLT